MSTLATVHRRAAMFAVLLVAAFASVTLLDGSPAWAAAKLTVSKTTSLADGQQITVSGSGFTPSMNTIAVGQCIKEVAGPSDCNLSGGSQFVNADATGKFAAITLKVAKKFGNFDCTKRQCVIAAQILPSGHTAAEIAANKASVNIKFGSAATGSTGATTTPTLPVTGPSTFQYVLILAGTGLLLPGIGMLLLLPARRRAAAARAGS